MIQILSEKNCCGCAACAEICPRKAIAMVPDRYGFPYPEAHEAQCSHCGLCDRICPVLNGEKASRHPLAAFAFMHKEIGIRKKSSTGGAFIALADKMLSFNGWVFGAAFDADWSVTHVGVNNRDGLERLVGSKYLQSRTDGSFAACKRLLQEGKRVLFSGTPCQIAGLRSFIGKDYDRLICVDLICHGVPAPGLWQKYLFHRIQKKSREKGEPLFVKKVNFRDKTRGWTSFSLSLSLSDSYGHIYEEPPQAWHEDPYMLSFLKHLNMRPSCFHCRFRNQRSGSDITIGDYWGCSEAHPEIADDKIGINALMINTEKGRAFFDGIDFDGRASSYEKIVHGNPQLVRSHWPHINRKKFLKDCIATEDFRGLVMDCLHLSLCKKILSKAKAFYMIYLNTLAHHENCRNNNGASLR